MLTEIAVLCVFRNLAALKDAVADAVADAEEVADLDVKMSRIMRQRPLRETPDVKSIQ